MEILKYYFIKISIVTWIERRISEKARERWRRARTDEQSLIEVTSKIDWNGIIIFYVNSLSLI